MSTDLDDAIYDKIDVLSDEGDAFAEAEKFDLALEKFKEALTLIPDPKTEWEPATWLYASMGDMYFNKNDFAAAAESFRNAMNCPEGNTNPFILLRLGECLYETNDMAGAKEHLLQAYSLESADIFEEEDPKYFALIKADLKNA